MAHYDRYLELLAQHNATGRAEDALQPLQAQLQELEDGKGALERALLDTKAGW